VVIDSRLRPRYLIRPTTGDPERGLPGVEVILRGPEGDAGVVRGASAEDLRPGVAHKRVALLLLFDGVVPVEPGLEELHPPIEPEDDILADVGRAGFEQPDADLGILAQSRGDRGSRRAAADDDVVKAVSGLHCQ